MGSRRLRLDHVPKLVRDFAVLAGGQVATKLIGLVVFAILARTLDPAGYGAVEYIVGLAAFMVMAIDCGLGMVGVRRIAAAKGELPALAARIPLARIVLALPAIPAMILCAELLGPPELPRALIWLYAASLAFAAFNQEWLLQSAECMTQVAHAQMLRMLTFAAMVILLVHGPPDVSAVGAAEIVAAAAVTLYYLGWQHLRVTPVRASFSMRAALGLIREGASLGLSQLAWAAAQFMPLFLVGGLGKGATVAWFAAAQRLVTSLSTFSYVYHFNLYPVLARAAATGGVVFNDLMRASFRVTAWLSVGVALALTLLAAPVLTAIYGARFSVAAPALAILVWVVPATILSGHARCALIVRGSHGHVLNAQLVGLVTIALAGIPLVMFLGDAGAAAAAVAGTIAVWAFLHVCAVRVGTSPPRLRLAGRPLALALILISAARFMEADLLLSAAGGLVLYAIMAPLLDRDLVPDFIRLAHAKAAAPSSRTA